jgi:hypothetical protein
LSQGFKGPIAQNEGLFYGLDTLPLFIAFAIYTFFWPGQFIPRQLPTRDGEVLDAEATPTNTTLEPEKRLNSEEH